MKQKEKKSTNHKGCEFNYNLKKKNTYFYITKDTIKQQTLDWRNIFVTHFTNEAFRIYREIKSIYNNTNQCENINNVAGKKCVNGVTKKIFFKEQKKFTEEGMKRHVTHWK